MTNKKRFVYYPFSRAIKDRETRWDYEGNQDTADFLNSLYEENKLLKGRIETYDKGCKEIYEENRHIKNSIQEAYKNERTALGRSVLKQLIDGVIKNE